MCRIVFTTWFAFLLIPAMLARNRRIVVLDNAPIHQWAVLMPLCMLAGITLLRLPPYSPVGPTTPVLRSPLTPILQELSPIEFGFSWVKQHLKQDPVRSAADNVVAWQRACDAMPAETARGYFRKCGWS